MDNIFNLVADITSKNLKIEKDKISLDSKFVEDLGADSLDQVELIMAFETEFEIDISDEDAAKIITVSDAVNYIKANTINNSNIEAS